VFCRLARCLARLLVLLGLGALVALLWRRCRRRPEGGGDTMPIPSWAYRQPDPLLYSQPYLTGLGYAVTWDNPDITIERNGAVVDQHSLLPATDYEIVTRVWNGSTSGPVADLPVRVSYFDMGIGAVAVPVGATTVDLGVKGAPSCPAFARVPWRTPATPGHYCVQSVLEWADDAEPGNNLGQSNTDVKPLNSPRAVFTFPVRNDAAHARDLALTVDAYGIPDLPPCDERPDPAEVRRRHDPAAHPVPEGWTITVDPQGVALRPGASVDVTVDITAPDGFSGRKSFNVNAWHGAACAGGMTLTVEGTA